MSARKAFANVSALNENRLIYWIRSSLVRKVGVGLVVMVALMLRVRCRPATAPAAAVR